MSLALQFGPVAALAGLTEQELEAEVLSAERARLRQGPDFDEALVRMRAVDAERRRRFAWKGWAVLGLSLGALALWIDRHTRRSAGREREEEEARLLAFVQPSGLSGPLVPAPGTTDSGAARLAAADRLYLKPGAPREVIEAACAALLHTRPPSEHAGLHEARDRLLS